MNAASDQQLFDYKQLGWGTSHTSAETAFAVRFSDSRVFDCYKDGRLASRISVSPLFKGMSSSKEVEAQYSRKYHATFDWQDGADYISITTGVKTAAGLKITYASAGKPLFDSNQTSKYMVVDLLDGKKVEFTRFSSIPEFPYLTRQRRKPFFYYQVKGEPRYECGAVDQPN